MEMGRPITVAHLPALQRHSSIKGTNMFSANSFLSRNGAMSSSGLETMRPLDSNREASFGSNSGKGSTKTSQRTGPGKASAWPIALVLVARLNLHCLQPEPSWLMQCSRGKTLRYVAPRLPAGQSRSSASAGLRDTRCC